MFYHQNKVSVFPRPSPPHIQTSPAALQNLLSHSRFGNGFQLIHPTNTHCQKNPFLKNPVMPTFSETLIGFSLHFEENPNDQQGPLKPCMIWATPTSPAALGATVSFSLYPSLWLPINSSQKPWSFASRPLHTSFLLPTVFAPGTLHNQSMIAFFPIRSPLERGLGKHFYLCTLSVPFTYLSL